jgi:hypothetical protein
VGPSGSGKSSVVRAGLIPALRREASPGRPAWRGATMVPGADPFRELAPAEGFATRWLFALRSARTSGLSSGRA